MSEASLNLSVIRYFGLMPSKDVLTCELVPNAMNADSLSCSVPPLESLDLWATNASIASAAFTALLALFAYMAWRKQKETLAKMEDQIVATAKHSVDTRQAAYLVAYVKALRTAAERCDRSGEDLTSLTSEVTDAWIAWSMDLFKTDPRMRKVTQWWTDFLNESMEGLRAARAAIEEAERERGRNAQLQEAAEEYNAKREHFYSLIGRYIGQLQKWQVDEGARYEVREHLASSRTKAGEEASA